jgi:NitT/TauT family transport system permease protein
MADVVDVVAPRSTPPTSTARRLGVRILPPILLAVVVIVVWQAGLIHQVFGLESFTLAYPLDIVRALAEEGGQLVRHAAYTLAEAGAGFLIGSIAGFVAALALSEVSWARRGVLPIVSGLAAMPVIALAPLMALYFGRGLSSKIAVVVIMTMPPMAVTAYKGFSSVDPELGELMVSLAATRRDMFRRLRLPWALPFVFTGLKLNVTLSLIGAIIAEFFAAEAGLGYRMSYALDTFDMPMAWGTMLLAALLGVLWYQGVSLVERLAIPWHASVRDQFS